MEAEGSAAGSRFRANRQWEPLGKSKRDWRKASAQNYGLAEGKFHRAQRGVLQGVIRAWDFSREPQKDGGCRRRFSASARCPQANEQGGSRERQLFRGDRAL